MAKKMETGTSDVRNGIVLTPLKVLLTHAICGLGLVLAFYAAHNFFSISLIENPAKTLRLIWVLESPVVVLLCSLLRHRRNQCSYLKFVVRGFFALPAGAVMNALGAMAVGALIIQNFQRTLHWSLFMPSELIEYMVCLPAHGAAIGAWFGAWPMPLDWERPWQEWPICVSYGAMAGYFAGMLASFGFVLFHNRQVHVKRD